MYIIYAAHNNIRTYISLTLAGLLETLVFLCEMLLLLLHYNIYYI